MRSSVGSVERERVIRGAAEAIRANRDRLDAAFLRAECGFSAGPARFAWHVDCPDLTL
jgi:hypothetical protein